MKPYLKIEWLHGRPRTGAEDDEARALSAAESVFAREGVTPDAAHAAYAAQWEALDDEAHMTGAATVWIMARDAADVAATEGWHNPDGGAVSLVFG